MSVDWNRGLGRDFTEFAEEAWPQLVRGAVAGDAVGVGQRDEVNHAGLQGHNGKDGAFRDVMSRSRGCGRG